MTLPARLSAAVEALRQRPIPVTDKSFGCLAPAGQVTAARLGMERRSLFHTNFTMPLLVLRETAVRQNIERMAAYCAAAGVELAPHGKTTMAPQLIARQLAAGAWGVTAATISQLQVFRAFGVPRVLLANELTDRAGIGWLAGELAADPGFECYVYVDSVAGVLLLDEVLRAGRGTRPLPVLVELGHAGGRTGCRGIDEALAVAKSVTATGTLRLAGAAGFEGGVGHDGSATALDAVTRFCAELRSLGDLLAAGHQAPGGHAPDETPHGHTPGQPPHGHTPGQPPHGHTPGQPPHGHTPGQPPHGHTPGQPPHGHTPGQAPGEHILSAGGSAFFDLVVRELTASRPGSVTPTVILRSGAYITHDHGYYARLAPGGQPGRTGPELVAALELWASVLSRPEPGLAILGAGRRDVAFDQGLPLPLLIRRADGRTSRATGMSVSALDDQHGYLSVPASTELAQGDLVCLGISHPCTTFDKWRVIPMVDDDYRVVDVIHTFF